MFAVQATRETRAVGVLLGGSGRAQMPLTYKPMLAALLKPVPPAERLGAGPSEYSATGA